MPRRSLFGFAMLIFACPVASSGASAQGVLGPGDDATVLPRGTLRIRLAGAWSRFDSRYAAGDGIRAPGDAEPLGADLSVDSLGPRQIETLMPLQSELRALSGLPNFAVSLGRTAVTMDAEVTTVPLAAELGLTRRLSVGVLVPIVRARTTVVVRTNPQGNEANLGVNPALVEGTSGSTARARNEAFFAAFSAARAALADSVAACATSASPNCGSFAALVPTVDAMFLGLSLVYAASDTSGHFVPITGTAVDQNLRERLARLAEELGALGLGTVPASGPAAATNGILQADVQRILTDPRFGFGAEALEDVTRTGVGDIEVDAKLQLLNTVSGDARSVARGLNARGAVGLIVRLGTGRPDSPDHLADIGTGQGQTDVELRSQWDLLIGRRFWATVGGRYGWQLADEQVLRITPGHLPLALAYRRQRVSRDLGDYLELEASPRWAVNDYFAVGGQYRFRSKGKDRYAGSFFVKPPVGDSVSLDASVLAAETEEREHRIAAGISYSTLAGGNRGRARLPIELSYQHWWSIAGSGGRTPRAAQDVVQLRAYLTLFGGRSPATP